MNKQVSVNKSIITAKDYHFKLINEMNDDISFDYIKLIISSLRSALNYTTSDVVLYFPKPSNAGKKKTINFPYKTRENVKKFFSSYLNIRNLNDNNLFKIFNNVQDYSFNEEIQYLNTMIGLDNYIKHEDRPDNNSYGLLRVKNIPFFPLGAGKGTVSFHNCTTGNRRIQDCTIKDGKVINARGPGFPVNLYVNNSIYFKGKQYNAILFLQKCIVRIEKFTKDIYSELNYLEKIRS